MPLDPQRVQAIFLEVAECQDPKERAAILDRECSDDPELRGRVEALLRAHDGFDGSVDEPIIGPRALDDGARCDREAPAPGRLRTPLMLPVLEPTRHASDGLITIPHPRVSVVASTVSAGWDDVRALIVDCQPIDCYGHASPLHVIAFNLNGMTRVEWRRGGRLTRYVSEPGSLTIIPAGVDHRFRTDRTTRVLVWIVDPAHLHSIAGREWGVPMVEILEACNVPDAEFWALGRRLADRMLSPIPGSRLCAEALDTELTLHLLWDYSTLPRRDDERVAGGQSPAPTRRQRRQRGAEDADITPS